MITVEEIVTTQKSSFQTLFGLTAAAFEGVEQRLDFNLQADRIVRSDVAQTTQAALSVKDAQK